MVNKLTKVLAGVMYLIGIVFACNVSMIILNGSSTFTIKGLIISILGVCIPIGLGSFLLIISTNNMDDRYKIIKIFLVIALVFYSILLVNVLFRNGFRRFDSIRNIGVKEYLKMNGNLIPFKTINKYISFYFNESVNTSIIIENLLGNLLLFTPMGFLLPSIFKKLRSIIPFIIVTILILLCIELLQLFTCAGSVDIDDIILNLFGASIFYGIWKLSFTQKILKKIYVL